MHVKMKDSEGHEIQVDQAAQSGFEARGFVLVGEAPPLAEGALVGHAVRVYSAEDEVAGPDHQPKMIQLTDGEQVIWADAALTQRLATFLARGFEPIPPFSEPKQAEDQPDEAFFVVRNQARRDYAAQVESIKQTARAKKGVS